MKWSDGVLDFWIIGVVDYWSAGNSIHPTIHHSNNLSIH